MDEKLLCNESNDANGERDDRDGDDDDANGDKDERDEDNDDDDDREFSNADIRSPTSEPESDRSIAAR